MQQNWKRLLSHWGVSALAILCLASAALGQVKFNEVHVNPPGTDDTKEFVEIVSETPNYALNNVVFVVIEGEGSGAGVVDQVVSFAGFSTGANRLFVQRDSATAIFPAPDPSTTVRVQDFSPDIENGGNTYLLAKLRPETTLSVGTDLDTDNDGVLDNPNAVFEVIYDAVSYKTTTNGVPAGQEYAVQLGGLSFTNTLFTPTYFALLPTGRSFACVTRTTATGTVEQGPWRYDDSTIPTGTLPPLGRGLAVHSGGEFILVTGELSPGSENPVPTVTVKGQVLLRNNPVLSKDITLVFRAADYEQPDITLTVTPGLDGTLPEIPNIPLVAYNVYIKYPNHLQKLVPFDTASEQPASLTATLTPGDVIEDELVDLLDLVELFDTYGLAPGDEGYNEAADFNGDEIVDLLDLVIIFEVYGEEGDIFE